jgi:DNA-binding MarR family transcriptional regulator
MQRNTTVPRESAADKLGREAFISLFLASGRLTAEVEKLCRDEQMTMSHYTVLWFLARRGTPEGVPMGAVIDGHLNRASDATRLADRLISLGMIERLASPNDRRVVLVRLTDKGRETYLRLTRRIQSLHRRQWDVLSPAELEQLRRLLAKVLGESREKLTKLSQVGKAELEPGMQSKVRRGMRR